MAFGVLDFIDADGIDLSQGAVFEAPGDDVFHRVENLLPGSAKRLRGFFPRKPSRPARQEQHVGFGQRAFAIAPGHLFDYDSFAASAVHAPHAIEEEDEKSPERNELKAPLRELVVTGRRLMAARTDRGRTLARSHGDLDTLLVWTEPGVLVDKP